MILIPAVPSWGRCEAFPGPACTVKVHKSAHGPSELLKVCSAAHTHSLEAALVPACKYVSVNKNFSQVNRS